MQLAFNNIANIFIRIRMKIMRQFSLLTNPKNDVR